MRPGLGCGVTWAFGLEETVQGEAELSCGRFGVGGAEAGFLLLPSVADARCRVECCVWCCCIGSRARRGTAASAGEGFSARQMLEALFPQCHRGRTVFHVGVFGHSEPPSLSPLPQEGTCSAGAAWSGQCGDCHGLDLDLGKNPQSFPCSLTREQRVPSVPRVTRDLCWWPVRADPRPAAVRAACPGVSVDSGCRFCGGFNRHDYTKLILVHLKICRNFSRGVALTWCVSRGEWTQTGLTVIFSCYHSEQPAHHLFVFTVELKFLLQPCCPSAVSGCLDSHGGLMRSFSELFLSTFSSW